MTENETPAIPQPVIKKERRLAVTFELANAIAKYLEERPFKEVASFLADLKQTPGIDVEFQEVIPPVNGTPQSN